MSGKVESPMWSYQLGLQQGWMPKDPRSSHNACSNAHPFKGTFKATATGGPGAGTIAPSFVSEFGAWPPASLSGVGDVGLLPIYTATGSPVPTLSSPTFTARNGSSIVGGNGWFDSSDTEGAPVNITGCTYYNAWAQSAIPMPTKSCGAGGGTRKRAPVPMITEPPSPRRRN